jgi:hypothetical protein
MRISGWDKFQGYKKRGPEWIKLHLSLIDQPEFLRLPVVARALLPSLWITAARTSEDGQIPDDIEVLSIVSHVRESELREGLPILVSNGFITCDNIVAMLATTQSVEQSRAEQRESRADCAAVASPKTTTKLARKGNGHESWLTPYFDAWQEVYPDGDAQAKAGVLAKYLRPLDTKYGPERVRVELLSYLRATEMSYLDLGKFAAGFGTWGNGARGKLTVADRTQSNLESWIASKEGA